MRARIFLLLVVIATPAMAFRARPVSDLRFENSLTVGRSTAVASDGSDYLVVLNTAEQTYIQIISQGVPYGPPVYIGDGVGVAAFWTGSQYVVAWAPWDAGVYLTGVSRRGGLLSPPELIMSNYVGAVDAVWNGRRILVTALRSKVLVPGAFVVGALADSAGRPVGGESPIADINGFSVSYALTGTSDGFALAMFGDMETRVYRLDAGARPLLAAGTLAEVRDPSGYYSSQGSVASDGTNVAVIFSSINGPEASSKSVIIGSRGEIVQGPRTIVSYPGPRGHVSSALWNGSEYVVALSLLSSDRAQRHVVLQRISRAGEPLDTPTTLVTTSSSGADWDTLAFNGREYLITSPDAFIRLAIGSTNPTAPVELTTRAIDEQGALSLARGRQGFLAVWSEGDRNSTTVRASRVDRQGRYLDGAGIVLDTLPSNPAAYFPPTSVDSNGGTWLAIWAHDGYIYGRRISPDGVVLDPKPIRISPGWYPVVRWGINSWLVVSVQHARNTATVTSATVTSDGIVGPLTVADEVGSQLPASSSYLSLDPHPALAFDGQRFVLAWPLSETSGGYPFYDAYTSIVIERLGLNGELVPGSRFILPPEKDRSDVLSLATNGSQDLVVFRGGRAGLEGLLLNEGSFFTTTTLDWWPGSDDFAVTWNGTEFVVARKTYYSGVLLMYTSRFGVPRATEGLPSDSDEQTRALVFPPSSPIRQPYPPETDPLGLLSEHAAYDGVPRAELLFAGDLASVYREYPAIPVILNAVGDAGGVTVTWKPQDHVLGFMIELRQSDGSTRLLGVAAGSATSTHISYAGLEGSTLRLRAWNALTVSYPSSEVRPTMPGRSRAVAR
jgi:hypothetical protein